MTLLSRYVDRDPARSTSSKTAKESSLFDDMFDKYDAPSIPDGVMVGDDPIVNRLLDYSLHLSIDVATESKLVNSSIEGITVWNHVRYSTEYSDYMTESHMLNVLQELSDRSRLRATDRLKSDRLITNNVYHSILSNDMSRVFSSIQNLALFENTFLTVSCAAKGTLLFTQHLGRASSSDRCEYNNSCHTPVLYDWVGAYRQFVSLWRTAVAVRPMSPSELWFLNHMCSYYCEMLTLEAL